MAEENKKFKLVYDKQGVITGSYSGIPANTDVALIDRDVLDGKEEPTPADPTELLHEVVSLDFGTATWTDEYNAYIFDDGDDVDAEFAEKILEFVKEAQNARADVALPFRFITETSDHVKEYEYLITYYNAQEPEYESSYLYFVNLEDIYINDASGTVHNTFEKLALETDAETGDTKVLLYKNTNN